jgi:hypothetical protein
MCVAVGLEFSVLICERVLGAGPIEMAAEGAQRHTNNTTHKTKTRTHRSWLAVVLVCATTVAPGNASRHSLPAYEPNTPGPMMSRSLPPAPAAAAIATIEVRRPQARLLLLLVLLQ